MYGSWRSRYLRLASRIEADGKIGSAGLTVLLEKVVLIDRCARSSTCLKYAEEREGAAHSVGGEVSRWGKIG